ncbi:MAG TPA: SRPBCC domain-containing protein [Gemmatimonadaceae bacterium]|nr:SRPBCC domain-containing protein [Gemmatimonadaceae bacterium]
MKGDVIGGPIHWRLHLPVVPERVFAALDSNEGRASFWAESAIEVDGQIEFRFINGYTCRGQVLERRPPQVWSVEYLGGPARFALTPDGKGGTDLLLTQEGVPPHEWNEVHAGWLNVLFPLKGWLAHGVDLRNHDVTRSWDQGYADQ